VRRCAGKANSFSPSPTPRCRLVTTACSGACTLRPALVRMASWQSPETAVRKAARVMGRESVARQRVQVCGSFVPAPHLKLLNPEEFGMRFKLSTALISLVACLSISMAAQEIRGDYLETRSADVYTGQCFANGEVNLVGNEAILAWHVQSGSWGGVPLQGLTVAAAVRAKGTLGDPYENPFPANAVLLVDDQASAQQRAALASFAQRMGGELLKNVAQVIP